MKVYDQDKLKYAELLDIAVQHATGEGMKTGRKWLEDSFNEYFDWHEKQVEYGTLITFGGQPYSDHNRNVLREIIKYTNENVLI